MGSLMHQQPASMRNAGQAALDAESRNRLWSSSFTANHPGWRVCDLNIAYLGPHGVSKRAHIQEEPHLVVLLMSLARVVGH